MPAHNALDDYLQQYWEQAAVPPRLSRWGNARNLVMHIGRISLPHPLVSPNHKYFAGTQFYWDTYFTIIGLIESGKYDTAKAMVDNLIFLFRKFGFMPARNSLTSAGRTQPPFFTRMIWEVFETGIAGDAWLNRAMRIAVREYETVWRHKRRLDKGSGLSRYCPRLFKKLLTVYESGWDVSTRFAFGRITLLPVDLNCLLMQYEKDIAAWLHYCNRPDEAAVWAQRMRDRQGAISDYFWDGSTGFFYDFDTATRLRDDLKTLAGFFPLWCGAATQSQAEAVMKQLHVFRQVHGLTASEKLPWMHRQWDYPNAWPPLQLIVIEGLRNYGYRELADEITGEWLQTVRAVYEKTGKVWEKYDAVRGQKGKRGRYPTQDGFSWTNGVYLRLATAQGRKR
ncbi:MAG: hypothetical protein ISR84_04735 [Kiritimatiellales bacterium]|nr:hypothetical protein [Kiritimatiellota bacterium]MBL7016846.1 hypothetical protein [Kiritimatiellales bacterium]